MNQVYFNNVPVNNEVNPLITLSRAIVNGIDLKRHRFNNEQQKRENNHLEKNPDYAAAKEIYDAYRWDDYDSVVPKNYWTKKEKQETQAREIWREQLQEIGNKYNIKVRSISVGYSNIKDAILADLQKEDNPYPYLCSEIVSGILLTVKDFEKKSFSQLMDIVIEQLK